LISFLLQVLVRVQRRLRRSVRRAGSRRSRVPLDRSAHLAESHSHHRVRRRSPHRHHCEARMG